MQNRAHGFMQKLAPVEQTPSELWSERPGSLSASKYHVTLT